MSEEHKELAMQQGTPSELINLAINKGADLDKLEKLLTLKERFDANEARKAYHKAMASFKANPPKIDKDKTVSFATGAGKTSYTHASLANVTEKISAELSKYGLSASWTTKQNGQVCVTCRITHELGHSEETTLCAASDTSGSKNAIQAIGSTITYLERYTLLALTGLATYDQDDDGQAAGGDRIDDTQLSQICDLLDNEINGKKVNRKAFLDYMKVEKVEDISKRDFTKAMTALNNIVKGGKP